MLFNDICIFYIVCIPPTPQKLKRYKIICSVFLFLNFDEITEK